MGSMGGKSEGRKKGSKYSDYQRPAESKGKAKVGKVPKGVQGHSLGGGAARANKGGKGNGCCYAGQAVKAVWMRKFKLARRFARLDVKTRLGLI